MCLLPLRTSLFGPAAIKQFFAEKFGRDDEPKWEKNNNNNNNNKETSDSEREDQFHKNIE